MSTNLKDQLLQLKEKVISKIEELQKKQKIEQTQKALKLRRERQSQTGRITEHKIHKSTD